MDAKQIIDSAKLYIETLFAEDYSGHDVEHSLRVYSNAILLADTEPQCNRLVVSLAALLHDVDDEKLFNTENNYNARTFLEKHQIDKGLIEQICEIINSVSFSKNRGNCPKTIEGKIVQDADRLLLLKNEINTEEGKRIAKTRHDFLKTFVDEIRYEINVER